MVTKTLICADCRKKFDVDPNEPRKFPGVCDDCSAERKETIIVDDREYVVLRKFRTSEFRD
jgi:hypothetical protein